MPTLSKPLQLGVIVALCAVLAGVIAQAVRGLEPAEVEVVKVNVESLRRAVLSLEDTLRQPPRACGLEADARQAVGAAPEHLGACGTTYLGRAPDAGPYWVEVSPGGVDFAVYGLARVDAAVVVVRATRREPAAVLEP